MPRSPNAKDLPLQEACTHTAGQCSSPPRLGSDCSESSCSNGWLVDQDHQPAAAKPGLQVLDLGWFNPLQSLQYNKQTRDVDRLIEAVCAAFDEMDSAITNKCFLTLKRVLQASMLVRGINSYDIAHLKKDALIRAGKLPRCLSCSAEAMQMSL
ncbi:hypothetical protein PC116_g11939 [Phytophthora cactorum]|uniref:Uncharacterized protein n=1 Tax=Phytophthora cactorum TaxID=29920 RepID=A0A329RYH5_9STRA|nr:hypothetical protein PC116_g11939 [Phytophthora cactorum]RAW29370.1 hypothetical protein PC110_g14267 [Phytophthora cactorum]